MVRMNDCRTFSRITCLAGNGTQSIVWQINEETYRIKIEESCGKPEGKPGLQVFYGSIHDILSYPCEVSKSFSKHAY
jgi:hypothetical protein